LIFKREAPAFSRFAQWLIRPWVYVCSVLDISSEVAESLVCQLDSLSNQTKLDIFAIFCFFFGPDQLFVSEGL